MTAKQLAPPSLKDIGDPALGASIVRWYEYILEQSRRKILEKSRRKPQRTKVETVWPNPEAHERNQALLDKHAESQRRWRAKRK